MKIDYDPGSFFDEMFGANGTPRPHYAKLAEAFGGLSEEDFQTRREAVDLAFLQQGITFTVYGNDESTEKIFPFDMVPRIITAKEWAQLEKGLIQRLTALNLFLHDIYHDQKIVKDGIIPLEVIMSGKHFRKEMIGFSPQKISISMSAEPI